MANPPFIPASTSRMFGPGESCEDAQPGDLVLVRHATLAAKGIRFFERLRVPREFCWTNHAAVVVAGGPEATVAQAEAGGVVLTPISGLDAVDYAVVNVTMTAAQRKAVAAFAAWSVGAGYGFLQIPADAFNAVTGLELSLGFGQRMVCSTAAARALERSGAIFPKSAPTTTPAHLAMWFGVDAPLDLERSPRG